MTAKALHCDVIPLFLTTSQCWGQDISAAMKYMMGTGLRNLRPGFVSFPGSLVSVDSIDWNFFLLKKPIFSLNGFISITSDFQHLPGKAQCQSWAKTKFTLGTTCGWPSSVPWLSTAGARCTPTRCLGQDLVICQCQCQI